MPKKKNCLKNDSDGQDNNLAWKCYEFWWHTHNFRRASIIVCIQIMIFFFNSYNEIIGCRTVLETRFKHLHRETTKKKSHEMRQKRANDSGQGSLLESLSNSVKTVEKNTVWSKQNYLCSINFLQILQFAAVIFFHSIFFFCENCSFFSIKTIKFRSFVSCFLWIGSFRNKSSIAGQKSQNCMHVRRKGFGSHRLTHTHATHSRQSTSVVRRKHCLDDRHYHYSELKKATSNGLRERKRPFCVWQTLIQTYSNIQLRIKCSTKRLDSSCASLLPSYLLCVCVCSFGFGF